MEINGTRKPDRAEIRKFLEGWLDYVDALSGPYSAHEAASLYMSERDWLVERLASPQGMEVWRTVELPPDTEVGLIPGSGVYYGRFWSCSRLVSSEWHYGGNYDDGFGEPPPDCIRVLLRARVRLDDVDMAGTVACRIGSSHEEEIRVLPGRKVDIVEATCLPRLESSRTNSL